MQGKLIVIDGTDGSGKGTQSKLLIERLTKEGKKVTLTDFPRHEETSGHFVREYLRGHYGTAEEVGPYRGSIFYAIDRYEASFAMRKWLSDGGIIVSNRYVSANMGHQAGKIKDPEERKKFLMWLKDLEFGIFGIPKPDINILLFVPPEIGQQLVEKKGERAYIGGERKDIHEADIEHLRQASQAFLEVAHSEGWKVIDCVDKQSNTLRSIEDIHKEIVEYVMPLI
jgi:dTMP kinase